MWDPASGVKFANNEPFRPFFKESQINLFAEDNRGDGVQHSALSVARHRRRRARPARARRRVHADAGQLLRRAARAAAARSASGTIDESLDVLRELEILVDGGKPQQYLLQIFLKEAAGLLPRSRGGAVLLRDHPAQGGPGLRRRQLPRAVRGIEREQQQRDGRRAGAPPRARACEDPMLDRMTAGAVPDKPHTALRDEAGQLRHEECLTRDGFDGPFTILYHLDRPHTGARSTARRTAGRCPATADDETRPLARRHYRSQELAAAGRRRRSTRACRCSSTTTSSSRSSTPTSPTRSTSPTATATISTSSSRAAASCARRSATSPSPRSDYVFVPQGPPAPLRPRRRGRSTGCRIECAAGFGLLTQWRNEVGQLRMDAPYSHRDFRRPTFAGPRDEGLRDLVVKRGGAFHGFRYPHAPLDVVGWDGTVYPWAFPILHFQPRVGLVHLPPTVHGTFATRGALICSFVPRPLDFHPEAIPCPYPHASVDCDEIIFYAAATSPRARASARAASRTTPPASSTARTPAPTRGASAPAPPTSWPSCSTPPAPCAPPHAARAVEDPGVPRQLLSFASSPRPRRLRDGLRRRVRHDARAIVRHPDARRLVGRTTVSGRWHGEHRALAELALHLDLAAVQLDQPPGQRQAEAGPLGAHAARLRDLLELAEQPRQVLARDADAGVGDRRPPGASSSARAVRRTIPPRGVNLMALRDQVVEHLLDAAGIDVDLGELVAGSSTSRSIPFLAATRRITLRTTSTMLPMGVRSQARSMRPASTLEMSRMSLTSCRRWRPETSTLPT